ncbi:hypothetical protein PQ455_01385 [Sphingomonas naphthae]|uniref:Uncharacterized protein n=1 Tax=Sphingomonas naphthae TaxID=1813468 RepID=A0ABY7TPY6_9SPHN|nr:hypothetical protein [Sphingomonas naphthae]WCT73914.1 hypothetical protein PQ455_01385 [Sphingomonas naphthae]
MRDFLVRGFLAAMALCLCGPLSAQETITAPAGFVPKQAQVFAGPDGKAKTVSAADPLPVSTPSNGTTAAPGSDATNAQAVQGVTNGKPVAVGGQAANGAAAVGNPNVVAGTDSGGVTRTLRTSATGAISVNPEFGQFNVASPIQGGTTATTTLFPSGGIVGPQARTSGQWVNWQMSTTGAGATFLTDSVGTLLAINSATGDAQANSYNSLFVSGRGQVYNGSSWDRQRDVTSASGAVGTGLLGAGVLGYASNVAPTATTAGNYIRAWYRLNGSPTATLVAPSGNDITASGWPVDGSSISFTGVFGVSYPVLLAPDGISTVRQRGDTNGLYVKMAGLNGTGGRLNNAALAASATYTSTAIAQPGNASYFGCTFLADASGGTAYVDMSHDGSFWIIAAGAAVTAGATLDLNVRVRAANYRCRFANGANALAALHVYSSFTGD